MSDYINDSIRVYVGCLASYSKGYHYGKWIDLEKDCPTLESFYARVDDILASSPIAGAKQWQIFDTTGLGGNICNDIKTIFEALEIKKSCNFIPMFNACLINIDSLDDLQDSLERFQGLFDSISDFAEHRDVSYFSKYTFCEKTGAVFAP